MWTIAITACTVMVAERPALAEGRYQTMSKAETLLEQGRRAEQEAAGLKEGRPDEAEERYEEAVEHYMEALRSDPGLVMAYVRLGYTFYALERPMDAVEVLVPALERWPDHVELHRVYGTVLYGMQGRRGEAVVHLERVYKEDSDFDVAFMLGKHYYESADWARAAIAFRAYLEAKPDDVSIHGSLGNVYLKTDKLEPALAEFRYVLSQDPDNIPAQINIANIRFRQRRWDEAIAGFSAVLENNPEYVGAHYNLAASYYQAQRPSDALTHYLSHARYRPRHVHTHYMIGLCHLDVHNTPMARKAFEATLSLDPSHARAYWRIGTLDYQQGALASAAEHLRKAHELAPEHAWTLIALGDVLREQGALPAAIKRHRQAISIASEEPAAHVGLGRDLFASGDLANARSAFARAYGLSPQTPIHAQLYAVSLIHHGHAELASGKADAARQAGEEVLRVGARPLEGRLLLAATAFALDDKADAARQADAAAKIDPQHPKVRLAVARVAIGQGQPATALEQLTPLVRKGKAPNLTVATTLGRACADLERWSEAVTWYTQAKKLGMSPKVADRSIAVASLRLGEKASLTEDWRAAVDALSKAEGLRKQLSALEKIRLDLALGAAYAEANVYGKALGRLRKGIAALKRLPADQRAQLPGADTAALNLRLAYVNYRLGQYERTIALIGNQRFKPGPLQTQARQLLTNTYVRQASKLFRGGRQKPAEQLLRKAQRLTRNDEAVRHNLAVMDYVKGRQGKAMGVFKTSTGVPEAVYNQAIFLDDVKRDKKGAFDLYSRYAKTGGRKADDARREVAVKKRVFGFGGGEP
ncbi:MAG: tetratricopeptide repeat protein [Myxococcota bacterium]